MSEDIKRNKILDIAREAENRGACIVNINAEYHSASLGDFTVDVHAVYDVHPTTAELYIVLDLAGDSEPLNAVVGALKKLKCAKEQLLNYYPNLRVEHFLECVNPPSDLDDIVMTDEVLDVFGKQEDFDKQYGNQKYKQN